MECLMSECLMSVSFLLFVHLSLVWHAFFLSPLTEIWRSNFGEV